MTCMDNRIDTSTPAGKKNYHGNSFLRWMNDDPLAWKKEIHSENSPIVIEKRLISQKRINEYDICNK